MLTVQPEPGARFAPQLCVGVVNALPVLVAAPTERIVVPVLDNVAVQVDTSPV